MPGKVGENLRAHTGEALASRTVATIACDVPVDIDLGSVRFGTSTRPKSPRPSPSCGSPRCATGCLALADSHIPASVSGAPTAVETSRFEVSRNQLGAARSGGIAVAATAAISQVPGAPCAVLTGDNAAEAVREWTSARTPAGSASRWSRAGSRCSTRRPTSPWPPRASSRSFRPRIKRRRWPGCCARPRSPPAT